MSRYHTRCLTFLPRVLGIAALSCAMFLGHGATKARAGGFLVARFGGEHAHPANGDVTSIYYNPAGIALGSGTRVYAEGLFAYHTASYERPREAIDTVTQAGDMATGTPEDAVAANAGKAELSDFLASPFLGVVSDLGVPNLGVGLAVFTPFGGQATWDKNKAFEGNTDHPGAVDGVQRWASIEGLLTEIYISGAASYRIPGPRLSFGASVSVVRSTVDTVRARTLAGSDDLTGSNGGVVEGRTVVDVSGTDIAFGTGVIWEPVADKLWIGASYQSQPGLGEQKLSGTLINKFGTGPVDESDVLLFQELPDVIRVGARFRPNPSLELRLQGDFQRWNVFKDQCLASDTADAKCTINPDGSTAADANGVVVNVRRDYNNTFGVRGGASYWLSPQLELGGSVAFDSNAAPDETVDAGLTDMNKVIINGTASYTLLEGKLALSASLLQAIYFDRTIEPQSRDADGVKQGFAAPSRVPDGAGTYTQSVSALLLSSEYRF